MSWLSFAVERIGFLAELDREGIGLARIEHAPGQLGRLAERDRQHAFGKRIERAAVADLDLAVARLAQHALDRRDGLGRTEAARLVEDQPAVGVRPGFFYSGNASLLPWSRTSLGQS